MVKFYHFNRPFFVVNHFSKMPFLGASNMASDSNPLLPSQAATKDQYVLATEDMLDCFNIYPNKSKLTVSINATVHISYRQRTTAIFTDTSKQRCDLAIKAPLGFQLHVEFLEQTCVRGPTTDMFPNKYQPPSFPNYVKLSGNGCTSYWKGCESWWNTVHEFISRNNVVIISFTLREWTLPYTVRMRVNVGKNFPWIAVRHLTQHLGE